MRFADALDRNVEEIVQPPNLPVGTYMFSVTKLPTQAEIADGRYEKLTFLLGAISATDDVDPDALAEYGNVNGTVLRKDFLFPTAEEEANNFDRTLVNLKRFLEHCGVDIESGSLKEAISASVNATVLAEVRHRPNPDDATQIYQEIGKTAPVE